MNTETKKEQTPLCAIPSVSGSVSDVVHYFNIKVLNEKRDIIEFISWSGLKWNLRLKYDWYFKYRAALFQVKYPKFEIQTFWGNEPATGKTLEEIAQSKIRGRKAVLTKNKNLLIKAKKNWNSLFPIEDDPDFKRAVNKIKKLELELESLSHSR